MTKELTVQQQNTIQQLLVDNIKAIKSVLPKHLTPERMCRIAYTAIARTPRLAECTQHSLLNAILEASMLGLEIGGPLGLAHLIPFGQEAQLIIGYQGFMDLAYRSDRVINFSAHPVYEKDTFDYAYGLNPKLFHVPSREDDVGKLVFAYAVAQFKNGGFDFEVVDKRIAMAAKARSAAKHEKDSPWNTEDEWAMWVKTAIRRLAKRIPQSPELQTAANLDDRAEAGISQDINIIDIDVKEPRIENSLDKKIKSSKPGPKPKKNVKSGGLDMIKCPFDNEAKTLAACEKACPTGHFESRECLARFPE